MPTKKAPKKPAAAKAKTAKEKPAPAKKAKASADAKPMKLSAIAAAAQVLAASKEPMNAKQMIEAMAAKRLWTSPDGKAWLPRTPLSMSATGPETHRSAGPTSQPTT